MAAERVRDHRGEIAAEEDVDLVLGEGGQAFHDQAGDEMRPAEAEFYGDGGPGMAAIHPAGRQVQGAKRLRGGRREVAHPEGFAGQRLGKAEARRVEGKHRKTLGGRRNFMLEHLAVARRSMQHHHGRPATGAAVMHAARAAGEEVAGNLGQAGLMASAVLGAPSSGAWRAERRIAPMLAR